MTPNSRMSIIIGMRAISFAAIQIQEATIARLRIDHPFVHVYVEQVRPTCTCDARQQARPSKSRPESVRKTWRTRDIVRSPITAQTKSGVIRAVEPDNSRRLFRRHFFRTASTAAEAYRVGSELAVADAIHDLREWSGVVPQQPPTQIKTGVCANAGKFGCNDYCRSGNTVGGRRIRANPGIGYAPT